MVKAICPKCHQPAYWFGCFDCHLRWGGNDPEDAVDYSANLKVDTEVSEADA